MICTIYVIKNKINSKIYVGQTWQLPHKRFNAHLCPTNKSCPKLFNALNKYGRSVFYLEMLAFCEEQIIADKLEAFFIIKFNSLKCGYNSKEGGRGGKHSEATKKKLSNALRGRKLTNEHKIKIGIANAGKIRSDFTKRKLSKINTGKKLSTAHKKNISAKLIGNQRRKGIPNSDQTRSKISQHLIGNNNRLGILHTDETKQLLSSISSGENNKNAKLTYENVKQIRIEYHEIRSQRKLAVKYNVSKTTIARIIKGESW